MHESFGRCFKMKGVEVIAEIVSLLVMIGLSAVLGGLIIITLNYVTVLKASPIDVTAEYTMALSPLYAPIKMEDALISYLESTDPSGLQIKKIITYAAYQETVTNVFVEGNEINLAASSSQIMSQLIKNDAYLLILNVRGRPYILADNKKAFAMDKTLSLSRISFPSYIDEKSIRISLNHELPLDVTLDLYVK